jgi:hypothetical protein
VKRVLSVLAVFAFLSACAGPPPSTVYDDGEQDNNSCLDPPLANATGNEGDPCGDAQRDCAVGCCECAPGGSENSYFASECYKGFCTDLKTACLDAPDVSTCD